MSEADHVHVKFLELPHPSQATTRGQIEVLAELDAQIAVMTKLLGRAPDCLMAPVVIAEEIYESKCQAQFLDCAGNPWHPSGARRRGLMASIREWVSSWRQ